MLIARASVEVAQLSQRIARLRAVVSRRRMRNRACAPAIAFDVRWPSARSACMWPSSGAG